MAAVCFIMYYCRHHSLFVGGKLAENMYVSAPKAVLSFSTSSNCSPPSSVVHHHFNYPEPNMSLSLSSTTTNASYNSSQTTSMAPDYSTASNLTSALNSKSNNTTTTIATTTSKTMTRTMTKTIINKTSSTFNLTGLAAPSIDGGEKSKSQQPDSYHRTSSSAYNLKPSTDFSMAYDAQTYTNTNSNINNNIKISNNLHVSRSSYEIRKQQSNAAERDNKELSISPDSAPIKSECSILYNNRDEDNSKRNYDTNTGIATATVTATTNCMESPSATESPGTVLNATKKFVKKLQSHSFKLKTSNSTNNNNSMCHSNSFNCSNNNLTNNRMRNRNRLKSRNSANRNPNHNHHHYNYHIYKSDYADHEHDKHNVLSNHVSNNESDDDHDNLNNAITKNRLEITDVRLHSTTNPNALIDGTVYTRSEDANRCVYHIPLLISANNTQLYVQSPGTSNA